MDTTKDSLKAQTKLVLDYLLSGRRLTSLIAMTNLGVGSLTTRISELRRRNYTISDEWSRDHFKRRYKVYWMESAGED